MGRRKIEITKILDQKKRHVTFSKRRQGLFNKARGLTKSNWIVEKEDESKKKLYELCTLRNVEAFMISFNGPDGDLVDMWPEDPRELRRLVHRYEEIRRSNKSLDDDDEFWWDRVNVEEIMSLDHRRGFEMRNLLLILVIMSVLLLQLLLTVCGGDHRCSSTGQPRRIPPCTPSLFRLDLPLLSEISALDINNYNHAYHRHCSLDVPSPMSWTGDDEIDALLFDLDMDLNLKTLF
ncbi:hypothetical protein Syun_029992 [Stephania yunnanensis]|uniref:MADS-box domain-containing protein n=1 Tax=Stephania yunnanensis TaxID=152371 RepID=A0AAP0HGI9_9MAGN